MNGDEEPFREEDLEAVFDDEPPLLPEAVLKEAVEKAVERHKHIIAARRGTAAPDDREKALQEKEKSLAMKLASLKPDELKGLIE